MQAGNDKIEAAATCGTRTQGDCWVEVRSAEPAQPQSGTIELVGDLEAARQSTVRQVAQDILAALGTPAAAITIEDHGAAPFCLQARIETAVRRFVKDSFSGLESVPVPAANCEKPRRSVIRSRLFVPGNTPKFMLKAGQCGADGILFDLEDAVAPAEKDAARCLVRNALGALSFHDAERAVRINPHPEGLEDARALAPHGVHTFVIPKVEGPEAVVAVEEAACRALSGAGAEAQIGLLPMIESARGVFRALEIAEASPSVIGLFIGLEDYARDIGAERLPDDREALWACSRVVAAARAAGGQPFGSVYTDLDNEDGLADFIRRCRALGFEGIACIHPRQVAVVHRILAPEAAEVETARRIVEAFERAAEAGGAVVTVDGQMVDRPIVDRAHRTLERADEAHE